MEAEILTRPAFGYHRRVFVPVLLAAGLLLATPAAPPPALTSAATTTPATTEPLFRVTLLGTGNPRPSIERFGPAILIEAGDRRLLFDAGRGVTQRLFQIDGAPLLCSVDTVLLTHLHSDHVVGLPDLLLTGWLFGRPEPLTVLGPKGTTAMSRHLNEAFAFDRRIRAEDEGLPPDAGRILARDVGAGVVLESAGALEVTAFEVDHAPVKPVYGYRIDFGRRSVVLSGDTRASEAVVARATGVDVLIHEVVAVEAERRLAAVVDPKRVEKIVARHTTAEECGRLFARARPRLAVYSHIVPSPATADDLIPATRRSYDGPLEVGHDLMTITVGEKIEVTTRTGDVR